VGGVEPSFFGFGVKGEFGAGGTFVDRGGCLA
jgi:hypothetical protein